MFLQVGFGPHHQRFDRRNAYLQHFGHFLVAEPFYFMQGESSFLVPGQFIDRLEKNAGAFLVLKQYPGMYKRGGLQGLMFFAENFLYKSKTLLPFPAPEQVERFGNCNAV